jgi:hypothetical protein
MNPTIIDSFGLLFDAADFSARIDFTLFAPAT